MKEEKIEIHPSSFSKPQITIDNDEYIYLNEKIEELSKSKSKFELDIHRGLITALVRYTEQMPNVSVTQILKEVVRVLKTENKFKHKLDDVVLEEDVEDKFIFLNVKYKEDEKRN